VPDTPETALDFGQTLDYARHLFDNYIDWYKNADAKAQVLLGLNGVFLGFLTKSTFTSADELTKLTRGFGITTWLLLAIMCGTMAMSIFSAIRCLWSRTYAAGELRDKLASLGIVPGCEHYPPQAMWFFQLVHELKPDVFMATLLTIDRKFATVALGAQAIELSRTVSIKHRWINIGFSCVSASLIVFLAAMVSYVAHVA